MEEGTFGLLLMEEGTFGLLLRAKFHPYRCNGKGIGPQN